MNKKRMAPVFIVVCLYIIAISGVISGIRHHETWRILVSSATLTLLVITTSIKGIKAYKENAKA